MGSESGERGKDLTMGLSWEMRSAMGDDIVDRALDVVLKESL